MGLQEAFDGFLQFTCRGQKLFHIHVSEENQPMARSDLGMLVLVEVIFAEQELNVIELTYPGTLGDGAKLAVVGIAWEGGLDLAEVAVGKGVFHHGHVSQGYRYDYIGFMGFKLKPNIAVTNDAQLPRVCFFGPFFDCRCSGLKHFVVGVRS